MEEKSHIYKLIKLDCLNKIDNQQKEELESWLNISPTHIDEYEDIRKIYLYSERIGSMNKIDTAGDLALIKQKINQRGQIRKLISHFQRIAAILIIPLLLYNLWSLTDISKVSDAGTVIKSTETAFGVRSQIQLSDGTKVWLNSGSKLVYPEEFYGNKREVSLIGEAYFQVESDTKHPFYVDLNGYKIKATGTQFNIANYPDGKDVITYLQEGKVALVDFQNGKEKKHGQLDKGEAIVLNKSEKKFRIEKVDGSKYLSWMDGKLIFRNDNMNDVANRLGRWYNADIVFDNNLLSEYNFTATFEKESLEEALILLSYSSPIAYKVIASHRLDDSSYSKRKVIISKRN